MDQVIYKYRLDQLVTEHFMPRDAVPVLVGVQDRGLASVWMKHRAEFDQNDCGVFTFRVKGTGEILDAEHIGSFIDTGGYFVWHIVMERPQPPIEVLTKVEDPEHWFVNYYKCPSCGTNWCDEWSATCDDECPECHTKNVSPFEYIQVR